MEIGKLETFNTGRPYSKDGQTIEYVVTHINIDKQFTVAYYTVVFNDATRNIIGTIELEIWDKHSKDIEHYIMNAYDNGYYEQITYSELPEIMSQ